MIDYLVKKLNNHDKLSGFMGGKLNMGNNVWRAITANAGETFFTKTGIPFSYHIRNNYIVLENTNRTIPRWQVEEAVSIQSDRVADYSKYQGYPYLFGLLHDSRIISY